MPRLFLFILLALPGHFARAGWALLENSPRSSPNGLVFSERRVHDDSGDVTLWVITFDPKAHTFAVMDNPEGAFDLGSAAEKRGAPSPRELTVVISSRTMPRSVYWCGRAWRFIHSSMPACSAES